MATKTNGTSWQTAAIRAGKDLARLIIFALPGILIVALTDLPQTETVVTVLAVLRFVDTTIHNSSATSSSGLLPF